MNDQERQAIAAIALLAAFADGEKADAEREEIRRVAQTLDGELPMAALYRDVLLKKTTIETAAAQLATRELKQLAYEFAVGVVEADGLRNAAETGFLTRLANGLGLDAESTRSTLTGADALASAPLGGGDPHLADVPTPSDDVDPIAAADGAPVAIDPAAVAAVEVAAGKIDIGTGDSGRIAVRPGEAGASAGADPKAAEADRMILSAAVMNGALELLPQTLASMAIIPLQMKLVYRVGTVYGYALDRGHVKDLLATMGVGVTGQYLEDIGRRLLGGVLGRVGGRLLGGLAGGATGVAFSFATTWAIGQVARRYYAGGRTMSAETLRDSFASLMEEAKAVQTRYAPQIEAQARQIDVSRIVEMVRGR